MIPIGTILFTFNEYDSILFCDGRKLPINEYKEFADFCIKQYGKANYFGGDGIKFIGLPDIQGCSIVVRDIKDRTAETDNIQDNVNFAHGYDHCKNVMKKEICNLFEDTMNGAAGEFIRGWNLALTKVLEIMESEE